MKKMHARLRWKSIKMLASVERTDASSMGSCGLSVVSRLDLDWRPLTQRPGPSGCAIMVLDFESSASFLSLPCQYQIRLCDGQ
jgi:hypothetical protein